MAIFGQKMAQISLIWPKFTFFFFKYGLYDGMLKGNLVNWDTLFVKTKEMSPFIASKP